MLVLRHVETEEVVVLWVIHLDNAACMDIIAELQDKFVMIIAVSNGFRKNKKNKLFLI
jgi:hypothetical protein